MRKDHFDVLRQLEKHHALFGQFWTVGTILETESIPTAAITFDKEGRGIQFLINPKFWEALTDKEKAFVIGHECLHVYFDHGRRMINGNMDRNIGNVAGDVVINHYLIDAFGFDREDIRMWKDYCWLETVFAPDAVKAQMKAAMAQIPPEDIEARRAVADKLIQPGKWRKDVDPKRSMEYYYDLIEEEAEKNGGGGQGDPQDGQGGAGGFPQTVDDHQGWADVDPEEVKSVMDAMQEVVDQVTERISNEELEDFEDKIGENSDEQNKAQQAGTMGGMLVKKIRLGHVIKKRKWETVVADIVGRFMKMTEEVEIETWTHSARRLSMMGDDIFLPSIIEDEMPRRDRVDLWFFQDTSGSCVSYAKRFFKAAASIPEDKFRIRAFCFDTQTYEVDFKKGELQGFGGTYFHIIEDEIQRRVQAEDCPYPQAVFIITDGYGSNVHPEHADRWHWFMTEGHSTSNIPKKSNVYKLKDYE